jgi:pimeloyl-[acyl-carrier protein] synthase
MLDRWCSGPRGCHGSIHGSANRDSEAFSQPDRLDITRHQISHFAFGRGIHHCLGAPLARLEAQISFETLLEWFAEIRLLIEDPPFRDNVVIRGLQALPVGADLLHAKRQGS